MNAAANRISRILSMVGAMALATAYAGDSQAARKAAKKAPKAAAASPTPAATANPEEIAKMKGDYSWGMSVEKATAKLQERVRESYVEKLKKTVNDPTRQSDLRMQLAKDEKAVRDNYLEFKGQTTGYDVSIVDKDFQHNTGESMLVGREETATRYLFFVDGKLYKMFIAFNKELIGDRTFEQFSEFMQQRFGKATAMQTEIKRKEQTFKVLSHYEWKSKAGDGLKLVDRSQFYDVYCLVVFDVGQNDKLQKKRLEINPKVKQGESLVSAVLNAPENANDENEDIVDRLTGKKTEKLGQAPPDIAVPSPTTNSVRAPTPAEVNDKSATSPNTPAPTKKKGPASTAGLEL